MKQFKFMMVAVLTAIMSFLTVSCSSDDDDVAKSNHDKKMEAVTAEVQKKKKSDTALLLVTFGSTWDAPQETFNKMKQQFANKFPSMDVYFSFTSEICMTRCAAKGWNYYAPSFYLEAIGLAGYKTVCVQSLHVIPGEEFLRVQNVVKDFHNDGDHPEFEKIKVYLGGPLLETKDDVTKVAEILHETYKSKVDEGKIVTFMGHGNPENYNYGNGNTRYTMMEEALQQLNKNYFVATVDMEDNYVDNMIARMKAASVSGKNVICHPLMSIAGDHANNDMKGGVSETAPEKGSWRYELTNAGYTCPLSNCNLKGLGDYSKIVDVWISHIAKKIADKEAMYGPESKG